MLKNFTITVSQRENGSFSTVTYTVQGTPSIERFSTKEQAEKRAKEVAAQYKVPVRVL